MNVPCLSISSSSVGKLPWSFRRIVYFDEPIDDYRLADRQRVSAFHIAAGPVRKFSSSSTLRKTPRGVRAWRSSQLRRGVVGRVTHRVVLP